MWHKGVRWCHVESDILKEGPGAKHPGRWEITERKIPSVGMLFKTNTNGHKHPSISLFIIEQDTIAETKENKCHSTQVPHIPQNSPICCDGVQLHQYWTTLPVYVYIRPITRTRIKNAYVISGTMALMWRHCNAMKMDYEQCVGGRGKFF